MLYVTGDVHGEHRWNKRCLPNVDKLTDEDILFVCGDFGHIFHGNKLEESHLNGMEKYKFTIAFVDGNHENFDLIYTYPKEIWQGGYVHRIRKNVVHLCRGQVFEIAGKRIFSMGGGYSRDKALRKEGISWWPQEMPNEDEYNEAEANLRKVNFKVDYILTHTAPEETMSIFHPFHPEEARLNSFLEWVRENTEYKHWYFGHLHRNEDLWRKQTVLWFDVRNMQTNESVFDEEGAERYF